MQVFLYLKMKLKNSVKEDAITRVRTVETCAGMDASSAVPEKQQYISGRRAKVHTHVIKIEIVPEKYTDFSGTIVCRCKKCNTGLARDDNMAATAWIGCSHVI